jgi:hypothetical protein
MQISILQSTALGTVVYLETQNATTNINGLVSIEIGSGTSSDDFSAIDWSARPYFIKTATDPTGGSTYTITGTSQFMSVPYALYAKNSGSSIAGPQAAQGDKGDAGGEKGDIGATGDTGATGPSGDKGEAGGQGEAGEQGVQGETGTQGEAGDPGGPAGPQEATGPAGQPGADGAAGGQGNNGDKGDKGDPGTAGAAGTGGVTVGGLGILVEGAGTSGDSYTVSTKVYTIGFSAELGGYVFRRSDDGRHGLVASTEDQSTSSNWFNAQDLISDPTKHDENAQKFSNWRLPTKYDKR